MVVPRPRQLEAAKAMNGVKFNAQYLAMPPLRRDEMTAFVDKN
jgi:hypothetical protein